MMQREPAQRRLHGSEIFIVDDDEVIRDTLSALLTPEGCQVTCFADGHSFLAVARLRTPACILLDLNMPDRSGLDMLHELGAPRYPAPILIVSGQNDVPTAVHAIRGGALDFIEKPFRAAQVIDRICEAISSWTRRDANGDAGLFPGCARLTPREHEVLVRITGGSSNKEAGRQLGISPRTVEVHRARIMDKLGAKNAADLVRMVLGSGHH